MPSLATLEQHSQNFPCIDTEITFTKHGNTWDKKKSRNLIVAPESLKTRLVTGEQGLLVSGGATTPHPRSFSAMQLPCPGMYSEHALKLRTEIMDGLRYILQTDNEWTIALHGTGTTATTAVLDNLIEVGDKVVVGVYGTWSAVAADIAERLGAKVVRLEKPIGTRLTFQEIEQALHEHKPKILYLLHGESTTGIYQPLEGVGDLCEKYGTVFAVDVVATVGQMAINMDNLKMDVVVMNTQKGIGGVVGLAPVSFSPKAIDIIKNRETKPRVYQTDIREQAREWLIEKPKSHQLLTCVHSVSVPLFHMLREGLANIVEEGIENVWARHAETNRYLHERASEMGLQFLVPKEEDRLPGTTIFKCPTGKNAFKISSFILKNYRIEISTGFGVTVGKYIRIGLFGNSSRIEIAKKVLDALEVALQSPETNF